MFTSTRLAIERAKNKQSRVAGHPPAPTFDGALSTVARSGRTPVAIDAYWDGDTSGWFVRLDADCGPAPDNSRERLEVALGILARGGDIRIFDGTVPPWPEAIDATNIGTALAKHFGIPFYFPSSSRPELDCPRWHQRHLATPCRSCGIPLLQEPSTEGSRICYSCQVASAHDRAWRTAPGRPPEELRIEDLWQTLGIPRDMLADPETQLLATLAGMEVFGEEYQWQHATPPRDQRLQDLFGRTTSSGGSFAVALADAICNSHPAWRKTIEAFQASAAIALAREFLFNRSMDRDVASVNLLGDTLVFDANQHSYDLPSVSHPRVVVDYGPGIGVRFILHEHLRAYAAGRPFVYIPVTKGTFATQVALFWLTGLYSDDDINAWLGLRLVDAHADGMLAATARMLSTPLRGTVDVVLCSGLQNADRRELEAGIRNAFPLLRPGGVLFIRSQLNRDPPESATVGDMLEIAQNAGFSGQRFYHSFAGDAPAGKRNPTLATIFIKP